MMRSAFGSCEAHNESRLVVAAGVLSCAGCAPTVDVLGVYFPGWLVSTLIGVATAYAVVWWSGRRRGVRGLAESGVFFLSVLIGVALAVWWILFSGFQGHS